MRVSKKVRVLALDKRYLHNPYLYAVSRSDSTGNYITGQEDILTEEEMLGKEKLTKAKKQALEMGDQPFIINPMNHYQLIHGRTFDESYDTDENGNKTYLNPRDHAELMFFKKQESVLIGKPERGKWIRDKHYFYVEDKQMEAQKEVEKADIAFEAEYYVRNEVETGSYKDILLMLSYNVGGYSVNVDMLTDLELKAKVIEACKEHPLEILKFKDSVSAETIFLLKLLKYHILEKKSMTDIYHGGEFIANSFDGLRAYINKTANEGMVSKWAKLVQSKEGSIPELVHEIIEPKKPGRKKAE